MSGPVVAAAQPIQDDTGMSPPPHLTCCKCNNANYMTSDYLGQQGRG